MIGLLWWWMAAGAPADRGLGQVGIRQPEADLGAMDERPAMD